MQGDGHRDTMATNLLAFLYICLTIISVRPLYHCHRAAKSKLFLLIFDTFGTNPLNTLSLNNSNKRNFSQVNTIEGICRNILPHKNVEILYMNNKEKSMLKHHLTNTTHKSLFCIKLQQFLYKNKYLNERLFLAWV